jgi:hypothetical protein
MKNLLNITHHEFQLIVGLVGMVLFFTFAGVVYVIEALTNKNK